MRIPRIQLILIIIIFLSGAGDAAANDRALFRGVPFEPENVKTAVERQGIHEVLEAVFGNETLQRQLRNDIRQGDTRWLELFVLLREHPEAEHGSMFDLDLAYALESSPVQTLNTIKAYQRKYGDYFSENNFPPYAKLVCGNVDEDWELGCATTGKPGTMGPDAVSTLERRMERLETVSAPDIDATKKMCMEQIKKSRAFWLKLCK